MKCPETFLGYVHCRIRGQVFCEVHVALTTLGYCIVCMLKAADMLRSDICYLPNNGLRF